jgi:hypothetical protein
MHPGPRLASGVCGFASILAAPVFGSASGLRRVLAGLRRVWWSANASGSLRRVRVGFASVCVGYASILASRRCLGLRRVLAALRRVCAFPCWVRACPPALHPRSPAHLIAHLHQSGSERVKASGDMATFPSALYWLRKTQRFGPKNQRAGAPARRRTERFRFLAISR